MLFQKILKKTYFKNYDNIVSLYSFRDFFRNETVYKQKHNELFDVDAYVPITFISFVLFLVSFLFSSYLALGILLSYVIFIAAIQMYLLRDIIKNRFFQFTTNTQVKSFEKNYIYNSNNFVQLMNEIEFDSLSESQKNKIINNISSKYFNISDINVIYHLMIESNNKLLKNKLSNFNSNDSGKNVHFFSKNESSN